MKLKLIFLSTVLIPVVLTGCTIPGTYLPLNNKILVKASDDNSVSKLVNLHPLNAQTIGKYNQSEDIITRANSNLTKQIERYEYQVGSGDVLNITVWDHPELTIPAGSFRSASDSGNWVHADGTIFYPYIGTIRVANKTVRQIRADIAKRLAKFIESPQVDVNVAVFRAKKAYVTGEVKNPGQQFITNVPLTLLDAVNLAGGLAENADWRNVTLSRNGKKQVISLYALMERGDLTQNHLLKPNDIIHVARNDSQKVFVMGEVNDPQLLKIDRSGMTLTEALSQAGGINELSADATGVFVIRASDDKSKRIADIYQLNIKDVSALVIGTEFDLQPYDILYVTAAPIARWNRVINQLIPTIDGFNLLTESALRIKTWP